MIVTNNTLKQTLQEYHKLKLTYYLLSVEMLLKPDSFP